MALTYESIATTTITGSAANITFSSIPSTYTDLVLIFNGNSSRVSAGDDFILQFNSDTTSNYSETIVQGTGSAAQSSRGSGTTMFGNTNCRIGGTTGAISNVILNIMNYTNTTTYKTVLGRFNVSDNLTTAAVGLWRKTPEAINTIKISTSTSGAFTVGSTATLYGIKAA